MSVNAAASKVENFIDEMRTATALAEARAKSAESENAATQKRFAALRQACDAVQENIVKIKRGVIVQGPAEGFNESQARGFATLWLDLRRVAGISYLPSLGSLDAAGELDARLEDEEFFLIHTVGGDRLFVALSPADFDTLLVMWNCIPPKTVPK
jgi:hypothetical protein